jgi:enterochelin esterase-like enzyme
MTFRTALLTLLVPLSILAGEKKWTPPPAKTIAGLIASNPAEAAAEIRKSWGKDSLAAGKQRWIEETTLLIAVTAAEPVTAVKTNGETLGELTRLDESGLYAFAKDIGNIQDFSYELKSGGKSVGSGIVKIEYYPYAADSLKQEGVPEGALHKHSWNESAIFPDTTRELLVYLPAQYDGSKPAALMVFQDGLRHADRNADGGLRAPTVLDNLIAKGEMPVTIGIFINPGAKKGQPAGAKPGNRSAEYDSLGDAYVNFLLTEIIPFAVKEHDLKLSDDPAMWAISGGSSGCACAWTAAWERPDKFGKVLGWVGTFVDIRGANAYPSLVRKTERKPIRAALLDGANDLDNQFGNWPLANRQMEAALKFMNYDYRYWWGEGFHGSRHAAALLPEMMKWLWSK